MLVYAQIWAFRDAAESRWYKLESHFFSGCATEKSDCTRPRYSRPAGEHHAGIDELRGYRSGEIKVGADGASHQTRF